MLKVIKPGFYSTIQDNGRVGQRAYGVPVSGAMDSYSSQFANTILGNAITDAVLEITMTGPILQFLEPTLIVISGANMLPKLNDSVLKMNKSIVVQPNDILSFGRLESGFRTYIAVKGGFLSPLILASRSMYEPVTGINTLKKDDLLTYRSLNGDYNKHNANVRFSPEIIESDVLEAYKGPEFNKLQAQKQKQLLELNLKVSKFNNRMAYQLAPTFNNNLEQIITAPVLPGTVQLTPSGQLIVLMRDCQTTGGYPRVLQLTEKAISTVSQKTTGNNLKFRLKE